jgi:[citrate (pro-3S)-lyase] ligase
MREVVPMHTFNCEQTTLEVVNRKSARACEEIRTFLARFGLGYDHDVDYTLALRDDCGQLIGTGSFAGTVLRNIAVDEALQGGGLTARILSALMQELARRGALHYFLFTRPDKAPLFTNLGFREIARAEPHVALLETGLGSVETFCTQVAQQAAHLPMARAALVVNCNPFTLGHQALIRQAAAAHGGVIVFVVSEERSLFPFAERLRLVQTGVADLPNVVVVPGGPYIISAATFPTYFTRQENQVTAQTRLDITLFASRIAPALGVTVRYVGEEPYCPVTAAYNAAMNEILPYA